VAERWQTQHVSGCACCKFEADRNALFNASIYRPSGTVTFGDTTPGSKSNQHTVASINIDVLIAPVASFTERNMEWRQVVIGDPVRARGAVLVYHELEWYWCFLCPL